MKNVLITICLLAGMVLVQGCVEDKPAPKQEIQIEQIIVARDKAAMEREDQKQPKQWTTTDLYDLQCLEEEISALRQIVSNKDGKWNAEMIRQCRVELRQKEAALSALHKKYQ